MHKKLLTIISILLFSVSTVMFANDISETVQSEQQLEQQNIVDFESDYNEYSMAEKNFADKYEVDPRNVSDVWFRFKSLINTGIKLAIGGGIMYNAATPTFAIIGAVLYFFASPIAGIIMYVLSGVVGLAGIAVQALCSIPFCKAGTLSFKYKKLYNVKLKNAAAECNILSMHDSENREVRTAMAFGIK